MPASAYIFGLCILRPMCSLGCMVILPFIIILPSFIVQHSSEAPAKGLAVLGLVV